MTIAQGVYHDGKTSAVRRVALVQHSDGSIELSALDEDKEDVELPSSQFNELTISSRIGNTPRYIYFACGGKFETDDNQAIDQWLSVAKPGFFTGLAHKLESHFRYVVLGLVVIVVFCWLSFQYLVPALSTVIVKQLPVTVEQKLGQGSLELMDKHLFVASTLTEPQQQHLQQVFQRYFSDDIRDYSLVLNFRHSADIGANAFALPSGDLLVTDDLVNLAASDFELLAVIAHEVGHVKYRHVMRRVVQDSLLVILITLATGDISTLSSAALAAPTLLLEMGYSRDFEREADQFALAFLQRHQIDTVNFSNIMARMDYAALQKAQQSQRSKVSADDAGYDNVVEQLQYYLSTHPGTSERLEAFGEPTIDFIETSGEALP